MDLMEWRQQDDPGVDVSVLQAGTKMVVRTKNSTYLFVVTGERGVLWAKGGQHIQSARKVYLSGSTWGGSCIKVGWVGLTMNMEIWTTPTRILTTTPVESIRIIGPNKEWHYDLP